MISIKYFTSPTCGPCLMFKPTVTQVLSELGIDADFINVSQMPDMAEAYQVRSVPTLVIIKDGTPTARHTGIMGKAQLQQFINAHK